MNPPVVLVTGATGFIGRNLVPLLDSSGYRVRRALRDGRAGEDDVVVGLIGPTTDWDAALAGVDSVIHLAARVHHPNEEHAGGLYDAVNRQGTMQLAQAAARAGVSRFVFLSTILVNGSSTDGRGPFKPDDAAVPRGVYGQSKAAAEAALQRLAAQSKMQIAVVRPPLVYGREALGNFRHLVRAIRQRIPLPLALVDNKRAFISVQNLVSFVAHLVGFDAGPAYQVYLVSDDEQISTAAFVRRIGEAMDKPAILLPVPLSVLALVLRAIRPELRHSLLGSMEVDTSAALSTGWRPPLGMTEGLRLALGTSVWS
ncbi:MULTISPECIES: NAD-dependent epimerase/dehydratase family protein [unclassified Bradyrhizobium]|uniref:NAD-dependent epimerase/dehydratase family protein n=1 Tax=unclassified Bradyrhizobium TaxID=2631580 RepID=UPI001FFA8ED3|nr:MULTISPECIES: NAD-dependent epimerase/dehydratase family protein [unclassified Bradyrhizobium]MCK1271815.1 NAD-dependent epimerase/dehydratase family protein [Bradyrhizobium sp. 84]MCK1369857.1 NAD-dependent epimerase/dehydratase family protein [Bradyrhizobium sp. 49]MCK1614333.1 NAD-dependent epimerase/dehydratase family protein [Bradyrhizobium sp. 163]MCK1765621.1 NAD-dependent epimerase/dehydratase family protein [Bradyrhizobium sp. 136]